jgi:uncharacterized protein
VENMGDIFVVGKTNEKEVYVASLDREFVLNEYLIVADRKHKNPVGEIIDTQAYPMVTHDTFVPEAGIKESLKKVFNYSIGEEKIVYIGKLKLLKELQTPIEPHSKVMVPEFEDIERLLLPKQPKEGFLLGVIQGTQSIYEKIPEPFKNVVSMFESGKIVPQNGIPLVLDFRSFREYPHMGLFGGTGSGKTFGIRVLCEEIMMKGIPGIVFDPHYELSFSKPMDGLPKEHQYSFDNRYEIFEIGENVGINFADLSTGELISLLEFIADLSQPMRGAIETLHEPKDSFATLISRINKLKKAMETMEKPEREREKLPEEVVLLYAKYKDKVAGASTLQAVAWRLDQLQKTGIFDSDVSQVEAAILKKKLAVIRGRQEHLKMIASYLIGKLYRKRRLYKDWEQMNAGKRADGKQPPKFPPFFIIIDEAHRFAPNGEYMNPTKRILREIAQEARKYGVFEIFGTQRPALLDTTITSQLNTKIIFRTGIEADMKMIKTETNLNEKEVARLPDLSSGNAFISSPTLTKTMYIRFRATKTDSPHRTNPFDELSDFQNNEKLKEVLKRFLPLTDALIPKIHAQINHEMNKTISVKEIQEALEEMAQYGEVKKETSPFGSRYSVF